MSRTDADGHVSGEDVPCQFEPTLRELAWQTAELPAETSAHYAIRQINEPPPKARYQIEQKPAHLLISADDALFARYNFLGVWNLTFGPSTGTMGLWSAGLAARTIRITQGFTSPTGDTVKVGPRISGLIGMNLLMVPAGRCCTNALSE